MKYGVARKKQWNGMGYQEWLQEKGSKFALRSPTQHEEVGNEHKSRKDKGRDEANDERKSFLYSSS
jgi:hypothetical protein